MTLDHKNEAADDGADMAATVSDVLRFWFEQAGPARWFARDPWLDRQVHERFAHLQRRASAGDLENWAGTTDGALALVILLDQFPRNLHREDPRAFADDAHALRIAAAAIDRGFDLQQSLPRRSFFYTPYMHSEDLACQELSVTLNRQLAAAGGNDESYDYAVRHRDIIARFSRFPHRNQILGRASTADELAFLATPGSSF